MNFAGINNDNLPPETDLMFNYYVILMMLKM